MPMELSLKSSALKGVLSAKGLGMLHYTRVLRCPIFFCLFKVILLLSAIANHHFSPPFGERSPLKGLKMKVNRFVFVTSIGGDIYGGNSPPGCNRGK